jgi:hypothetical protein
MTLKNTIIFILLLGLGAARAAQSQEPMKHSVVAIEYVGESDKPVTPIIISDSKARAEWYRDSVLKRRKSELTETHVISASLLQRLIADIDAFKGTVQAEGETNAARSKAVSMAVITATRNNAYSHDTGKAILLLESLQKSCKNGSLRASLAHFEDRVRALLK